MIADRRKEQVKSAKKTTPKKTATVDRSVATGRAKRNAAVNARRGMTQQKKPSAMEVDREVYRQSRKTAVAKKNDDKKAYGGRLPPNSSVRDVKKKGGPAGGGGKKPFGAAAPTGAAASVMGGRTPSKKQVEAAIQAMANIGQPIPPGHQLVLTFVPVVTATKVPPSQSASKKGKVGGGPGKNNNTGGGRAKGQQNKNNNDNRSGRGYKN
jgi:hypothetical protein